MAAAVDYNDIEQHRIMLEDKIRTGKFREAIFESVKPGDLVVDIGTGTGILAMFAVQAGARHVYAMEDYPIIGLAKQLAEVNGVADKITFLKGLSWYQTLEERVDVIISECFGSFAIREQMIPSFVDARDRFLKPEGKMVPMDFDLWLAPVSSGYLYEKHVDFFKDDLYGFDFTLARDAAVNSIIESAVNKEELLSGPQAVAHFDLTTDTVIDADVTTEFVISVAGELNCLVGYFESKLSAGVHLSTSPYEDPTHWCHDIFPFDHGVRVEVGDRVKVRLTSERSGDYLTLWKWTVEILPQSGDPVTFSHRGSQ